MSIDQRLVRGSVVVFYLLIGLEIIIMISPFAAYFYGVYGPVLNFLYGYRITAWLTGFFMPHAVVSKSGLLNFLNGFGRTLFSIGLILFIQIYLAKFRRKGVVTGLFYRWIRHPQYLFLAIAGLGLLLFWPRFVILVLYISMLFVYYLLARYEEQQLVRRHGEGYRRYMERTAMFIPGSPGERIFRALFGRLSSRGWALAMGYGLTLLVALVVAFGLRSYTISQTAIVYVPEKNVMAISILPRPEKSLRDVVDDAFRETRVAASLDKFRDQGHRGFLVHVMPQDYMMQRLFANPAKSDEKPMRHFSWRGVIGFFFPFLRPYGHDLMMGGMSDGSIRLIFSQLTWPNGEYAAADEALRFTVKHLPILKADLNLENLQVYTVEPTSRRNFWGQMPMPLF
jgi:protein-S-isoprenylcysteine O-methyltransferase Ste14